MNEKQKTKLVRNIIKAGLHMTAIVAVFLILGAILSRSTITFTVNWVKAFIGLTLFYLSVKVYNRLFPTKRFVRKDDEDVAKR